jgi:VCBS repeat-containing protein
MKSHGTATSDRSSLRRTLRAAGGGAGLLESLESRQLLTAELGGSVVFVGNDVDQRDAVAAIFADAEVITLDASRSGIDQVSEILAARSGLSSVQFFTHAQDGALRLGTSTLDSAALKALSRQIAAWGKSLSDTGDLVLWGCDVAATGTGASFVNDLARLTGADVAASTDRTGPASRHADWLLEYRVGKVESVIASAAFGAFRGTLGNNPPTIGGTVASQPVSDNATVSPFSGVTIGDNENDTLAIIVSLNNSNRGVFTPGSLASTGFVDAGGGSYTFSGSPAAATTAIRGLVFNPSDARVPPGSSETTTFTISADDPFNPAVTDSTTTVVSTAVNDAPVISGAQLNQPVNDNATILPFANLVISDADDHTQVVDVTLTIDESYGDFTVASLINSGFSYAFNGVYFTTTFAASAQTGIRQLVFQPNPNRVAPGMTETSSFTIEVNDGIAPVTSDTVSVLITSVNDAPTIAGAVASQAVNDNATVSPFTAVTIADVDTGQTQSVSVTLDNAAKGVFTPDSLTASGFQSAGGGVYTFSGSAAAATTAIRQLVFNPSDNRVNPGLTETTTFTIGTNDGVASTVTNNTTTVVSISVNDAPSVGGAVAGQTVNDVATVSPFTAVTISDPDASQNLAVTVTLDNAAKGVFTPDSLTASGFVSIGNGSYLRTGNAASSQAAIRQLVFNPTDFRVPEGQTETTTFTISVTDAIASPVNNATTTVISAATNATPTISSVSALPGATARDSFTITYATLLAASNAADQNSNDTVSFRIESVTSGTLTKNGAPVSAGNTLLGPGEELVWTSAAGVSGNTAAFVVRAWDGTIVSTGTAQVSISVAAPASATAAEGANVAIASTANGLTTVATRNDAGQAVLLQQQGANGAWARIDLSALNLGTVITDAQVFVDAHNGNTYAAFVTNAGVILVYDNNGTWTARNLTAELSATAIASDLITLATTDGLQLLAGKANNGDIIAYYQTGATGNNGQPTWTAVNLYDRLRNQSEPTPTYASPLTTYVTSWNGLNIAGLDAQGNIWTVWTGGGLEAWHSTNLSAITGAPALVGNVAAYTTSWGGINLAGVDTNGDLTVTWWVPGFEGNWLNVNMTTRFGGPDLQAGSITAYVTPWSALNITGLDADGEIIQYWWVPPPQPDQWNVTSLTDGLSPSIERYHGRLTGFATPDARLNVVGQSAAGHILRTWWSPTTTWALEDLTALV